MKEFVYPQILQHVRINDSIAMLMTERSDIDPVVRWYGRGAFFGDSLHSITFQQTRKILLSYEI